MCTRRPTQTITSPSGVSLVDQGREVDVWCPNLSGILLKCRSTEARTLRSSFTRFSEDLALLRRCLEIERRNQPRIPVNNGRIRLSPATHLECHGRVSA